MPESERSRSRRSSKKLAIDAASAVDPRLQLPELARLKREPSYIVVKSPELLVDDFERRKEVLLVFKIARGPRTAVVDACVVRETSQRNGATPWFQATWCHWLSSTADGSLPTCLKNTAASVPWLQTASGATPRGLNSWGKRRRLASS